MGILCKNHVFYITRSLNPKPNQKWVNIELEIKENQVYSLPGENPKIPVWNCYEDEINRNNKNRSLEITQERLMKNPFEIVNYLTPKV